MPRFVRQINSIVDSDARLQARMVRPRVRGDDAATQISEKHDEERRQSGKSDNLKQLERLRQEVNDANRMSLTDKATLKQALAELGTNLGVDHKNQSPFVSTRLRRLIEEWLSS